MAYGRRATPSRIEEVREPVKISGTINKINVAMQAMTDFSSNNSEFLALIRDYAYIGGELCYLSKNFAKAKDYRLAETIFLSDKELSRTYMYAYMKFVEDCHTMKREAVYNDSKSEVDKLNMNYWAARKYLSEFIKKYMPEYADVVVQHDIDKSGYGAMFSDDI